MIFRPGTDLISLLISSCCCCSSCCCSRWCDGTSNTEADLGYVAEGDGR